MNNVKNRFDDTIERCNTLINLYESSSNTDLLRASVILAVAGLDNNDDVDSTSIIGRLRNKIGARVDLPTEAQWEYACRAGTTTMYSYGDEPDNKYMWCGENIDYVGPVGTKISNQWGLYDMHGNIQERVLDWYGGINNQEEFDPVGPNEGSSRVARGRGNGFLYLLEASTCTSSSRFSKSPSFGTWLAPDHTSSTPELGFRLFMPVK